MKIFATKTIIKNKCIKLSPLMALLFLASCVAPKNNQPMNFCDYVDPNSVYYNPNKLSLTDLNNCRIQAEKILAIQSLQLQIQKQREVVIALNNMNNTSNQSVQDINSALSSLPQPNDTVADSKQPTTKNTNNRTRTSQGNINNRGSTVIVAQKTNPQSVQQRFLNSSANNKNPNNNLASLSQKEYDAKQAAHVATQVNNLLTSQNVQESLNQPKALLPGEETTANIAQPTANTEKQLAQANTKPVSKPIAETDASILNKIMNARKATDGKPAPNVATEKTQPANQVNQVNQPNNNTENTVTAKPATTEPAKSNDANKLSTSYTSSPPEPKSTPTSSGTNPVANVVKPPPASNNNASANGNIVDNKSNVDNYQSSPLPALNGANEVTPVNNTSTPANPLTHLQQNRIENKQ